MKLTPITIEEVILLGITRFYILEEGDHLISIKLQEPKVFMWDSYKQEWRSFFGSKAQAINATMEYINLNKCPIFIKSNKETNDTNSK